MRRFLGADIDRIANGAPSILITSRTITELLTSSGTSGGQPKLLLSTEELDLPLQPPHPRHEQARGGPGRGAVHVPAVREAGDHDAVGAGGAAGAGEL